VYTNPTNTPLTLTITTDKPTYFDELDLQITQQQQNVIVQENNYYAFGLNLHGTEYTNGQEHRWQYNEGSEKLTDFDLWWDETPYRIYDKQLGIFWQTDELADMFSDVSPYQYAYNNPINYNDPTGLSAAPAPKPQPILGDECPQCDQFATVLKEVTVTAKRDNGHGFLSPFVEFGRFVEQHGDAWRNTLAAAGRGLNEFNPIVSGLNAYYGYTENRNIYEESTNQADNALNAVGAIPCLKGGVLLAKGAVASVKTAGFLKLLILLKARRAAKGVSATGAVWAQTDFGLNFSIAKGAKFAGKTVDDVAEALRNRRMSVSEVQIDVIVRNGQTFILNTRSSVALTKAGIPRSFWNVVNQTGVEKYETMLTNQLLKNNLPNGTRTIFQRGTNKTIFFHH
jgi:RHS repeat-associated protein